MLRVVYVLATCALSGAAFAQATPGGASPSGSEGSQGGYSSHGGSPVETGRGSASGGYKQAGSVQRGYPARGGSGGYAGRGGTSGGASVQPSSGGYVGGGDAKVGASGQSSSGGDAGHGAGQGGYGSDRRGLGGGHDIHGEHGGWHGAAFDRSNPRWWQGRHEFSGYAGHRDGFVFAPGYGYRPLPTAYIGRAWAVGAVLPPELRSYPVVDPTVYGVDPAPPGYRWIYVNDGVALVDGTRGVIVRSVWHIW